MSNCPRGARFFGCKFEPRYDSKPTHQADELRGMTADEMIRILCIMTYVRDVCVRCGKTIERGGS